MKQSLNIFLLLTVAIFSLWCTGGLMRKNDQATILAGAYDLAQGRMRSPDLYYQFDKTYILYGTCAAIFKAQQLFRCDADPVAVANISLALLFWAALTVFVLRFRRTLSPLALLCVLTAPAVLLNTLYVNSSVLSSAFLLLSTVFLFSENRRTDWLAALLFFLAVGSRADVIILLPLLLWLITPFPVDWKNAGKQWKLLFAGALALAIGRMLCRSGPLIDPFFSWKTVAGYTLFGFGSAGLLFAWYSIRLAAQAAKGRSTLEKLYGVVGLFAFLLPVLFFIPQLHTPRYFWRGCEAILLLAASSRLSLDYDSSKSWVSYLDLFKDPTQRRKARRDIPYSRPLRSLRICVEKLNCGSTALGNLRSINLLLIFAALIPLIVGLNLPALHRPQITVLSPTLFPSGDGFYPMGGYIPFMLRLRHADENLIDHNQRIWTEVQQANFLFDEKQSIRVLHTPMFGYFMLGATLRGGWADCRDYAELSNRCFYADSRSLMRTRPDMQLGHVEDILTLPAHFVSPAPDGVGVLDIRAGDERWGRQTRLLNRLFSGNEYRVFPSEQPPPANRMTVYFSDKPFETSQQDEQTGLYYSDQSTPEVRYASAVHPPSMSLQAFGKATGQ